ncbi:ESCRT-II complex, vps25 subunit [Tothia fuscella]|uniref:Vacuolar protein-sorting-associated protein 25 n=1 Tax=Tothia fuscella TaxID=1048955 RepID=A0A9P4NP81_9PEZI|nr:ESCRT-II complex, vps25 subunit [Tothia fuscella]
MPDPLPPAYTNETFPFPPHYSFPPFFTLQPNPLTRTSQLQSWSSLILSYTRHHRLSTLSVVESYNTPLFHNPSLNRRLPTSDIREILTYMSSKDGGERVEWIGKHGKDGGAGGKCWVYWRRPEEWADVLESWVERTGQKGVVLTLYEIGEGDATVGAEFHGLDPELLQKSLGVLVKKGRAQIFGAGEDQLGVKFF